jgi:phosphate uptake regulator
VSLPSEWARSIGLKPKDEVYLVPQTDMSLLLTRKTGGEKALEGLIEAGHSTDEEEVLRQFIAYYIAGYDAVRIRFRDASPLIRSKFKAHIREKLIGVEIVEESSEQMVTQCLHGYFDLPVKRALSRMGILAEAMLSDAAKALVSNDTTLATEIVERDDEVDRFSHFIARQLNLAVHNRLMIQEIGLSTAQDCLNYRLIVKSIERTADHGVQIANCTLSLEKARAPQALMERIEKLAKLTGELFDSALRAVNGSNARMANESILKLRHILKEEKEATEELISSRLDNNAVVALRLALESLRRMAEYSADICELVVNLAVGSPE